MTRCFVEPTQWPQPEMALSPEESWHLARVLRARPGDRVGLVDGQGHTAQAIIRSIQPQGVRVTVLEETRHWEPRPAVSLTLIQAIPKHSLLDWIIQKATELGVTAIWPIQTEHVIVRANRPETQPRCQRWQKIVREAGKQSGVSWFPDIQPVMTLAEVLPRLSEFDWRFVASLHEEAKPLREMAKHVPRAPTMALALIVGPEGDLIVQETLALKDSGALLVRLGPATLRVETAALVGLSVLRYEFAS